MATNQVVRMICNSTVSSLMSSSLPKFMHDRLQYYIANARTDLTKILVNSSFSTLKQKCWISHNWLSTKVGIYVTNAFKANKRTDRRHQIALCRLQNDCRRPLHRHGCLRRRNHRIPAPGPGWSSKDHTHVEDLLVATGAKQHSEERFHKTRLR